MNFTEVDWEKLYIFLRFLNKKLPKGQSEKINILNSVDLGSLRIQMIGESNLSLENKVGELEPMSESTGGERPEEVKDLLSHIIERINEVYGIELTEEDKVDLSNVSLRMNNNDELKSVMTGNNSESDKKDFFDKILKDEVSEYYGDRLDFYKKITNNKIFPMILEGLYKDYKREVVK